MGGLAKGLAIVELFDGTREGLTSAEAARATGTSRATARRCLLTLEELGYVARERGPVFVPRARMARLGRGYVAPATLSDAVQPLLERLRDELQEPVAVATLDGVDVMILARAESARIVTTGVRAGGRLPVYCSATGRILIGNLPQEKLLRLLSRTDLVRLTSRTCVDPQEIVERVSAAKGAGVAYCDEELEMGMRSMAVPLRNTDGMVRFALSMSTSSARTTIGEMERDCLPVLRRNLRYFEDVLA